jgi:hypothetical protein
VKLLLVALAPTLTALLALLVLIGALPWLVLAQRPITVSSLDRDITQVPVVLVRTASGGWLADGQPVDAITLERRLAARGASLLIRFLPSPQLSVAEVSSTLAWLRSRSAAPVELERLGG